MDFNVSTISNIALGIGALFLGAGYAYGQFFAGKNKQQKDTAETGLETMGFFRAQIEGLQNLTKQLQTEAQERQQKHQIEIKDLHGQMENLRGQLQEKDKLLDHYTKIFQGRDPQLSEILQNVAESLKNIEQFMGEMKDNVSARQKGTP